MSAPVLVLLALAAAPCDDVFDRAAGCEAPARVPLEGAAAPLPAQKAPDVDAGATLAPQYFAAAGVVGFAGAWAAGASFWYGAHLDALSRSGALDPSVTASLHLQQGIATGAAVGLVLTSALLASAGAAFLVFDPARGTLVEGFPPIEE